MPTSLLAPNRFLTVRTTRWFWWHLPLEIEHCVDNVFQRLGASQGTVLVMCPIRKTDTSWRLANATSRAAHSRICPMEPGTEDSD